MRYNLKYRVLSSQWKNTFINILRRISKFFGIKYIGVRKILFTLSLVEESWFGVVGGVGGPQSTSVMSNPLGEAMIVIVLD